MRLVRIYSTCYSQTCAVDVFSLGCIYYYVLTDGKHPFGDNLRRQANIMQGEYSLKTLNASSKFYTDLIKNCELLKQDAVIELYLIGKGGRCDGGVFSRNAVCSNFAVIVYEGCICHLHQYLLFLLFFRGFTDEDEREVDLGELWARVPFIRYDITV